MSDSHRSAIPSNWKSSMYQDISIWREPGGPEGHRVTHRQGHQMVDTVRDQRSHHPGQGRSPVVAHHVGPVEAQVVEDGQHVTGQSDERVGLDLGRLAARPVATEIGHDDLEPGRGQGVDLMVPHPSRVRKAVEQHDRSTRRR